MNHLSSCVYHLVRLKILELVDRSGISTSFMHQLEQLAPASSFSSQQATIRYDKNRAALPLDKLQFNTTRIDRLHLRIPQIDSESVSTVPFSLCDSTLYTIRPSEPSE